MIDWKRKLSSRKLWAAACAFVCALCMVFGVDEMTMEKLVSVVSSMGVLAVYILTEGYIDAQNKK
jgi:hypothetical protein